MKKVLKSALLILSLVLMCLLLNTGTLAAEQAAVKAVNTADGIGLSWNYDGEVKYYKLYRKEQKDKEKSFVAKVEKSSFTDKTVKASKQYTYSVIPFDKKGEKGKSLASDSIIRLTAPSLSGYTSTASGIKLSWTRVEGATSYRIYRKYKGDKKWKLAGKVNASTFSFTDKNVKQGKRYVYTLKSVRDGSTSYRSNRLNARFIPVAEISKITLNKKSINISWQKVTAAEAYEIYRTEPDGKKLSLYKTVKPSVQKLKDKAVKTGKKYGYCIRAVIDGKKSALTSPTYCLMMKMPEITKAKNTTKGIHLSWTKVPSAHSYNLYRRDFNGDSWKKILNTSSLSATDTTAVNAKKYVYTVRAVYNKIQSTYDKDGFISRYLTAPEDVKVDFVSKTSNRISWTPNREATAYNVYRRAENGTEWTRIARTSKVSFTDKEVKKGKVYAYYVRAYIKTSCKSAASSTVLSTLVNPKGKLVALTYDDGPSNTVTNRILDILEKYSARATFFVLGSRIDGNYEPLQRAVKLGCEIGNHTYGHVNLPSCEKEEILSEISRTNGLVKKYAGVVPKLARAPGGSTSDYSRRAVNMPFIYWSIDTRDWETGHPPSIIAHVKNEVRDGSIILMHDIYHSTADATEVIVPWLINEGYQLVTVSELMRLRGVELKKGVTYYNAYR